MSKLSEDLESALSFDVDSGIEAIKRVVTKEKPPGYEAMSRHTHGAAVTLLRSARYHFAGAAPWENGDVAIEATANFIHSELIQMELKTLAAGIEIGQHHKWRTENYDKLIGDSGFQFSATIRALEIAQDHEAMDQVSSHIAAGVAAVAEVMGFRQSSGKETAHVWDVWYGAMGSTSMSLYEVGYQIGQKWHDEEILSGIAQATENEVRE